MAVIPGRRPDSEEEWVGGGPGYTHRGPGYTGGGPEYLGPEEEYLQVEQERRTEEMWLPPSQVLRGTYSRVLRCHFRYLQVVIYTYTNLMFLTGTYR